MTGMSFEKALTDLENIVQKLEKGGLSLNESLALFEKGVKLAKFLREELGKAEKKVEILLKDEQKDEKGNLRKKPFDLDREVDSSPPEQAEGGEEDKEEEPPF